MSRIGKEPVPLPSGVEVSQEGEQLLVRGPKGELSERIDPRITITVGDEEVTLTRSSDEHEVKALHGLYRALLANMVHGVSEGFTRRLEIVGVGYRAAASGSGVTIQVGYSHPVEVPAPEGITLEVPAANRITVSGASKQLVGQVAANIRGIRAPEPYKGKGIRYEGEIIRRKAGKAAGA